MTEKMATVRGIMSRFKNKIGNSLRHPEQKCNILDLPDYLLECICQCLLGNESVTVNFLKIAAFRATCSKFHYIANQLRLKFPVVVHYDSSDKLVQISPTNSSIMESWLSKEPKALSEDVLEVINYQLNWKCYHVQIAYMTDIELLLESFRKYSNMFYKSLEVVSFHRVNRISLHDLTKFVNVGLDSFFASNVRFQMASPEVFDNKLHPFVVERCYEVCLLSTREFNLITAFTNLTTLWLFEFPVDKTWGVTLANIKTLFLDLIQYGSRSTCLFVSEMFPNVTYLFLHTKPACTEVMGDFSMQSLISLCADWYMLKAFRNCPNIRHVKQLNRTYGFDRFARVRMKELQFDILTPSGNIDPFWKNLKMFAFDFRHGSELTETLDEIVRGLKALLIHNQVIQVISGAFFDKSGDKLSKVEENLIHAKVKLGDCLWYENHASLMYFKMGFDILVMKVIDKDLDRLINQMDYCWAAYGWNVRSRCSIVSR